VVLREYMAERGIGNLRELHRLYVEAGGRLDFKVFRFNADAEAPYVSGRFIGPLRPALGLRDKDSASPLTAAYMDKAIRGYSRRGNKKVLPMLEITVLRAADERIAAGYGRCCNCAAEFAVEKVTRRGDSGSERQRREAAKDAVSRHYRGSRYDRLRRR
jgi:hypothetical protein